MANPYLIPQFERTYVPMKGTTIRISENQLSKLDRLKTATHAPSVASALRLCLKAECEAVDAGHRTPADFIPSDDKKPFSLSFKITESDREKLACLMHFYGAKNYSQLICHIIDRYGDMIDASEVD